MKAMLILVLLAGSGVPTVCMAATRTATLAVPGMTCPVCPITVKKALKKVTGVIAVTSDMAQKTVTVTYDDAKVQSLALTKATAQAGYPSTIQRSGKP